MGWGKMLLLGDWGLQMNLDDQAGEIENLKLRMRN
jgi:hypothetical protein